MSQTKLPDGWYRLPGDRKDGKYGNGNTGPEAGDRYFHWLLIYEGTASLHGWMNASDEPAASANADPKTFHDPHYLRKFQEKMKFDPVELAECLYLPKKSSLIRNAAIGAGLAAFAASAIGAVKKKKLESSKNQVVEESHDVVEKKS